MAKLVNLECKACALVDSKVARQKSCWDGHKCHSRRSKYRPRNRLNNNQRKRESYARSKGKPVPKEFKVEAIGNWCQLVLYGTQPDRFKQAKGIVSAIAFKVYSGEALICYSQPLDCRGLEASDLEKSITIGLGELKDQFELYYLGDIQWSSELPKELTKEISQTTQKVFKWVIAKDRPEWYLANPNSLLSIREQLQISGSAIVEWAENIDKQLEAYLNFLAIYRIRDDKSQGCVVQHNWNYPQTLMLQQVSIGFLKQYQENQEPRKDHEYPRTRTSSEKIVEEEISAAALLAIAHSEDIELWKELVAQVITNEPKSFHDICRLAQDLDWGKDSYSKAKVYLGVLLSENFEIVASEESFYQDFVVTIRESLRPSNCIEVKSES